MRVVVDTNCEAYQVGVSISPITACISTGSAVLILRSPLKRLQHAPLISSPANILASTKPINKGVILYLCLINLAQSRTNQPRNSSACQPFCDGCSTNYALIYINSYFVNGVIPISFFVPIGLFWLNISCSIRSTHTDIKRSGIRCRPF